VEHRMQRRLQATFTEYVAGTHRPAARDPQRTAIRADCSLGSCGVFDSAATGWSHVGHANGVRALAMRGQSLGSDLVCATADNRIWQRSATAADVNWTVIGAAPATVGGLAYQQSDSSLWVATRDNRLWKFRR
jgi:hypothetical protein